MSPFSAFQRRMLEFAASRLRSKAALAKIDKHRPLSMMNRMTVSWDE
jgi:hypothetical protein